MPAKKTLPKTAIKKTSAKRNGPAKIISFAEAERVFSSQPFALEKEMVSRLLPHLKMLIYDLFGEEVLTIETEKAFDFRDLGFYRFRVDVWIECKSGEVFCIEVKNPTHSVKESMEGITQLMQYRMAFEYIGKSIRYALVTSVFKPFVLKFVNDYGCNIDTIVFDGNSAGIANYSVIKTA